MRWHTLCCWIRLWQFSHRVLQGGLVTNVMSVQGAFSAGVLVFVNRCFDSNRESGCLEIYCDDISLLTVLQFLGLYCCGHAEITCLDDHTCHNWQRIAWCCYYSGMRQWNWPVLVLGWIIIRFCRVLDLPPTFQWGGHDRSCPTGYQIYKLVISRQANRFAQNAYVRIL